MSSIRPGRILISLVGLTTAVGAFLADFNDTHIYNPRWPGHAKFHTGQTMSMAVALCSAVLWHLWVPTSVATKEARHTRLRTAVLLASLYWFTQMAAYRFPGTTAFDVLPWREGSENQDPLMQFKLELVMLSMVGAGWWLEQGWIESEGRKQA